MVATLLSYIYIIYITDATTITKVNIPLEISYIGETRSREHLRARTALRADRLTIIVQQY